MKSKIHSDADKSVRPAPHGPDPSQKRSSLWIVLIFFISGWVFFLGVIVGRGTAPALFDYKKIDSEIQLLAKNFSDSQKAKNDMETDTLKAQAELGYAEELHKNTDEVANIPIPAPEASPKPAETPSKPVEKPKPAVQPASVQIPAPAPAAPARSEAPAPAKSEPAEAPPETVKAAAEPRIKSMYDVVRAAQTRESAPSSAPERAPAAVAAKEKPYASTPASAPEQNHTAAAVKEKPHTAPAPKLQPASPPPVVEAKSAPAQSMTIHTASLLDRTSADAMVASLKSKGMPAYKIAKMVPGKGVWYQVIIGKYNSQTEADAMLNRLRQENVDASIVKSQ